MMTPTASRPPALNLAIEQVRGVIKQTSSAVLATVYRTVAHETHRSAVNATIQKQWADTIEILEVSSEDDIAAEFKRWVEKSIDEVKDHRMLRDFLVNVTNGILSVARSN